LSKSQRVVVILPFVNFVTDFADQAVVLPVALAVGVGLLAQGWRRGAAAWALVVVSTFGATLALKLVFLTCSPGEVRSPSGHVAAAVVVAGGLAALLLRRRGLVLVLAFGSAAAVGASRLVLGMHSLPEVAVGAVVGLAGAWVLPQLAGRPPPELDARRLVMIAAAVAVVFHGLHLPAEAHILRWARALAVCQPAEVRL
jgi:membrane-associated phospholipid phosphatase